MSTRRSRLCWPNSKRRGSVSSPPRTNPVCRVATSPVASWIACTSCSVASCHLMTSSSARTTRPISCPCRKPKPGLLVEAAFQWHLDLDRSFVVSDKWQDAEAARTAGCTSLLLQSPWVGDVHHDFVLPDLEAIVDKILQLADGGPSRGGIAANHSSQRPADTDQSPVRNAQPVKGRAASSRPARGPVYAPSRPPLPAWTGAHLWRSGGARRR